MAPAWGTPPPLADVRNEEVLGWYDLGGRAYINLDIASDPDRLTEVANHETTHHLLASTTPYGFVQQIVNALAENPYHHSEVAPELARLLMQHSRWAQEAAATYSALAVARPGARDASVARLPPFYRDAYAAFADLLESRDIDGITRSRLARAIAGRAFQTPLLRDWFNEGLAEPRRLAAHAAVPANAPDARLVAILGWLKHLDDDVLVAWAGRYDWGKRPVLVPETTQAVDGVRCVSLPPATAAHAFATGLVEQLSPGTPPDEADRLATFALDVWSMLQVVLQPPDHGHFAWPAGSIDAAWCEHVDFISFDVNESDETVVHAGPSVPIPPGHAVVRLFRPDEDACRLTTVPLDAVRELLSLQPALTDATVSLGGSSLLPARASIRDVPFGSGYAEHLASWLPSRRLVIYAIGDVTSLYLPMMFFSESEAEPWSLLAALVEQDSLWGHIVLKPTNRTGPLIVYPTLLSEWERVREAFMGGLPVRHEPVEGRFYSGAPDGIVDFVRFNRVFTGAARPLREWRELEAVVRATVGGGVEAGP
jgi:hypothetical protein